MISNTVLCEVHIGFVLLLTKGNVGAGGSFSPFGRISLKPT